jgi:hypothetical protein
MINANIHVFFSLTKTINNFHGCLIILHLPFTTHHSRILGDALRLFFLFSDLWYNSSSKNCSPPMRRGILSNRILCHQYHSPSPSGWGLVGEVHHSPKRRGGCEMSSSLYVTRHDHPTIFNSPPRMGRGWGKGYETVIL